MKILKICGFLTLLLCSSMVWFGTVEAKSVKPFDAVHVVIDKELISPQQAQILAAQLQKTFLVSIDVKSGEDGANSAIGHTSDSGSISPDPTIFINPGTKNNPGADVTEIAIETDIARKITRIAISDYDDPESEDSGAKLPLSHFYKLILQQVGLFAGRTDGGCVMKSVKSIKELDELDHSYCPLDQKMLHEMGIFKFDDAMK